MRLANTLRRLPWDDRRRAGGLGHAVRLLSLLRLTLAELDEATGALVANIDHQDELEAVHGTRREALTLEQQQLFEECGRLSVAVHHRVDTFFALARLLLDRVAQAVETDLRPTAGVRLTNAPTARGTPRRGSPVAERSPGQGAAADRRGLRRSRPAVTLERYGRTMTATVWSSTGDAAIAPGRRADAVALADVNDLLEEYVADVVDELAAGRSL